MRKATLWMLVLCFILCVSCEKALLEETTDPTPTTKTDTGKDNKDDQGGGNGSGSDTEDGDDTGGSDSDDSGNSDAMDTTYVDNGTSGSEEKDIVDGNDDTNKDKPSTSGLMVDNSKAYNVTEFINNSYSKAIWVVGYIVGDCTKSISNANFDPPFSQPQALLLADDPNEKNIENVITIQLSTSRRNTFALAQHPENKGKRLAVFGMQTEYLKRPGMKNSKESHIGNMKWYDE